MKSTIVPILMGLIVSTSTQALDLSDPQAILEAQMHHQNQQAGIGWASKEAKELIREYQALSSSGAILPDNKVAPVALSVFEELRSVPHVAEAIGTAYGQVTDKENKQLLKDTTLSLAYGLPVNRAISDSIAEDDGYDLNQGNMVTILEGWVPERMKSFYEKVKDNGGHLLPYNLPFLYRIPFYNTPYKNNEIKQHASFIEETKVDKTLRNIFELKTTLSKVSGFAKIKPEEINSKQLSKNTGLLQDFPDLARSEPRIIDPELAIELQSRMTQLSALYSQPYSKLDSDDKTAITQHLTRMAELSSTGLEIVKGVQLSEMKKAFDNLAVSYAKADLHEVVDWQEPEDHQPGDVSKVVTQAVLDYATKQPGTVFLLPFYGERKYQFFTLSLGSKSLNISFAIDDSRPVPILVASIPYQEVSVEAISSSIDYFMQRKSSDKERHRVPLLLGLFEMRVSQESIDAAQQQDQNRQEL